jgi:hypothetical protein
MDASAGSDFEVKTDGEMNVKTDYLTDAIDAVTVPGKDLVADYMQWYWNYNYEARSNKELDYTKFMEFSYELSEKAAPFLENCDLDNEEVCK